MNFRRMSLSRRLMAILIGASLAYWTLVVVIMINDSVRETHELFDTHLAQTATALLRAVSADEPGSTPMPESAGVADGLPYLARRGAHDAPPAGGAADPVDSQYDKYERDFRYQIWNREGTLLLRSANAPNTALTEHDGFSETTDSDGEDWRIYGVWDRQGAVRVIVGEAISRRTNLLRNVALNLIRPMVLGLPMLLLLLWYSIRRGLRPLHALTREISQRHAASLTPVDLSSSPAEIRPIALALNDLLKRVEYAVESERCFTANAAHELRTPLAAIQAHLAAARAAASAEEKERSLTMLQRSVARSIRLVGQLLTLARLDPEQMAPDAHPVDVGALLESTCAELAPLALQRNQVFELAVAPDLPAISGNADMLTMLFTNLIDNAIRYTGDGGHVSIGARRGSATEVCVDVTDDGPGIPPADRARVFERFYRLEDQNKPGTGLGLAICQRVIELHSAKIYLSDGRGGKGLSVQVRFPAVVV